MPDRKKINLWLCDYQYDWILRWKSHWLTDGVVFVQEKLVEQPGRWLLCKLFGHEPVADQCNRPEHDLCLWCQRSMPDQAQRRAS